MEKNKTKTELRWMKPVPRPRLVLRSNQISLYGPEDPVVADLFRVIDLFYVYGVWANSGEARGQGLAEARDKPPSHQQLPATNYRPKWFGQPNNKESVPKSGRCCCCCL